MIVFYDCLCCKCVGATSILGRHSGVVGRVVWMEGVDVADCERRREGNHFSSSCVERGRMRVVSVCLFAVSSIHLVVLEERE